MPIPVKCSCGKAVNVRDDLAGKAIKCPGCGKPVQVGSGSAAAPSRAMAQATAAAPPAKSSLDDLFTEEGFDRQVAAVCPACRVEMAANAVLCTKCGYNKQTGERLESHKTAGVDISHGELALNKATRDMAHEKALQEKMENVGMPWWMMALVLFFIISAVSIAVVAINVSRRVDGAGEFKAMATFLILGFGAVLTIAIGAYLGIIIKAFKQEIKTGLLTMFIPPYLLFFCWKNLGDTWRLLATVVGLGIIAGALYAGAVRAGL